MRGTKQLGGSNRDGRRTIGKASIEVRPDGLIELLVDRIVELYFCGGHRKEGAEGRERRRVIE
jgi:hypothetical protein